VTDGDLDFPRPAAESRHTASDVERCLVLVTSYLHAASLVERVTTEAAERLILSPSLGDFIKLRNAHIGHQPSRGGQHSAATRITDHLLQPQPGIGRNYFAVVILDQSAATVEGVLQDCAASPLLSALPIRLLGLASREDRRVARLPSQAEILISPAGAWQRQELVDELLRYASTLMHGFAGGRQPGLTADEMTQYRDQDATAKLVQDALEPAADPRQPSSADPSAPAAPPVQNTATGSAAEADPDDAKLAALRSLPRLARRLVPELRRRRGRESAAGQPPSPAEAGGLAYLLLIGDQDAGDLAEWNRSRALILEIDQRLAALPRLSVRVRVLQGDDKDVRGDLRAAGQLTKRDVRGAVSDLYLSNVLDQVRVMLGRDRARPWQGPPLARPAVLLIAPVPPMADSVAVTSLRRLAEDASVAWVVPKSQADLMSDEFIEPGRLITDFSAAADDLAALFPSFRAPDDVEVNGALQTAASWARDRAYRHLPPDSQYK
jgi:hypothetical protein